MEREGRLQNAFGAFFLPSPHFYADHPLPHAPMRTAAVLILLAQNGPTGQKAKFSVLLTVRSRLLRRHPGEVCFPGGMRDLQMDKTPVETALRETYEEIGLPPSFVRVLGTLQPFVSLHHIQIFPVLALIKPSQLEGFQALLNATEVEALFWAPLERFLSREGHGTFSVPGTDTLMHLFQFEQHIVFGITAILCVAIAIGLLQRLPAFSERVHTGKLGEEEQNVEDEVRSTLRLMFHYFGQIRDFVEPEEIHAAMPASKL